MLTPAHHEILAKLYAANVPPEPGASFSLFAEQVELLTEALVAIDPNEIPLAQTQNVLGCITFICSQSGAQEHALDPVVEFLRRREVV